MSTSRVSQYSEEKSSVLLNKKTLESHLGSITDQTLVVSIIGPFQTGKSSFVSHFTGERINISIGDGNEEETQGVWLYGPYQFNALKRRWGLSEVSGDSTKVLFVDTEGFGGKAGRNSEENRLILCELTAPFLAISQVCLLMHKSNIQKGEQETFKYFLEVTANICTGANSGANGKGNMNVVDLVNSLTNFRTGEVDEDGNLLSKHYKPTADNGQFQQASQYLRNLYMKNFGLDASHHLIIDKFWALPHFSDETLISEQGDSFQTGFRLVAQQLLSMLERIKVQHSISGQGALEAFHLFHDNIKNENFQELARRARVLAELGTAERILLPFVEAKARECTAAMDTLASRLVGAIQKDCKRVVDTGLQALVSQAVSEIESFSGISPSAKKSERFTEIVEEAKKELSAHAIKLETFYDQQVNDEQHKAILIRIENALKGKMVSLDARVLKEVDSKRSLEKVPLEEIVAELKEAVDQTLDQAIKELNPSHLVAEKCKNKAYGDAKQMDEALRTTAQKIVVINKESWRKFWTEVGTKIGGTLFSAAVSVGTSFAKTAITRKLGK